MSRLYLVRKNLELYLGPMDIMEFKEGYKKLKFGPDAEICSSLKKWVKLSDHQRLASRYPQIASIVSRAAIWEQSMAPVQIRDDHAIRSHFPRKQSSFFFYGISFLIIALVIIGVWGYKEGIFSFSHKKINIQVVTQLLSQKKEVEFLKYMESHIAVIVPDASKHKTSYTEWIPYIRYYAYKKGGSVVGMKPQLLKGAVPSTLAPLDCSMEGLRSKLGEELQTDWKAILHGSETPSTIFQKMFFWDPYWIKIRVDPSWIQPINYYQACLIELSQVIKQDQFIIPTDVKPILEARVDHLLSTISPKQQGFRFESIKPKVVPTNILGALSCIEEDGDSEVCIPKDSLAVPATKYLAVRKQRMDIFSMLSSIVIKEAILSEELSELYTLRANIKPIDQITQFNYSSEYQLITYMQHTSGSIKKKKKMMEQSSPEINLK